MNAKTFTVRRCDGCGHKYHKHERAYCMAFHPIGAPFEVQYTVCARCYSLLDADMDVRSKATMAAFRRDPDAYAWAAQHTYSLADVPAGGTA
ncbi:MAG TPA: hypothetical protein VF292_07525 [Rhodanobacteraceae bacterium]